MRALLPPLLVVMAVSGAFAADRWAHPLYLGGGGVWHQRVMLEVRNDTDREAVGEEASVALPALTGTLAEAVRVTRDDGVEVLYALTGPDGLTVKQGPIPSVTSLTIPAECQPKATARYWVYFDNPAAWTVPDFLKATSGIRNAGLELGEGNVAAEWQHDANDGQHRTFWTTEAPHSGSHCLKTVVTPGAEPTWISTRQSGLRIVPGAKYVFSGWVKADSVDGQAGWYIHVGNSTNTMLISPMPVAGSGTYDWKQVRAEFTAPADANRADLGTVLRGTGTAWFDDVALTTDATSKLQITASAPERLPLKEIDLKPSRPDCIMNAPVRVMNWEDQPRKVLVAVNAASLLSRAPRSSQPLPLRVVTGDRQLPHALLGSDTLIFLADLPPRTIMTYRLLLGGKPGTATPALNYESLLNNPLNLTQNPSFELGDQLPDDWPGGAEGEKPAGATLGFDEPGLFGKRCVKIDVPHDSKPAWTGWRQSVPVQPGRTYLYAAWLKCRDLKGNLQLHAHKRTEQGELSKESPYTGIGPAISGTTGWTQMAGLFTMPADCRFFQLHLTMNATGTAWHDGVLLAEAEQGELGPVEGRTVSQLEVWPISAVRKVFRYDAAAAPSGGPMSLSIAANEREPLQLAIRAPKQLSDVRLTATPPTGPAGKSLPAPEINVVGYVPIDHPLGYDSQDTPEWVRKFPTSTGGSDGFAGWWPDPLLPDRTFAVEPNQTQPVWVMISAPSGATPGDYRGTLKLVQGTQTLWQSPYTVRVRKFALPSQGHLAAIYDCRQSGAMWQLAGKTQQETRQEFWKFMADHRVCPDRIQPDPVLNYKDGQVTADFTAYDKAATYYFDVLKLPHSYMPSYFYCFGWGFPPARRFGEEPYEGQPPFEGADRSKLRPEYKRAYQACLKAYWEHMKQKGWADRVVLYISDEPYDHHPYIIDQMKALCDMIHEVDPAIRVYCSNWHEQPAWEGYLDVWGVGHYGVFSTEKMQKLTAQGDTIWFTTDGQMCTDTPYAAIERLLPHYAFKYGARAYEFWGIDWLTYNPYEFGWHAYIHQSGEPGKFTWVRYPSGDGFLAYPGKPIGHEGPVTSIRLEQAREGMEDYEYLWLLKDLADKAKPGAPTEKAAREALQEASGLVDFPSAGGRYSTKILPDPEAVYRLREKVAGAIEGLMQ
ncbi:MAG: glycoside hydrolase domain-containing protein [Armatimonadia bacterium]